MPPRIDLRRQALRLVTSSTRCPACQLRFASIATTPAASPSFEALSPIQRYAPTQPPSHKSPHLRKSQLHRQYQSLLRSSPLLLLFQHNNLKASEWAAIRRELASALSAVNKDSPPSTDEVAAGSKIHILNTGIFESALKVVEFWTPPAPPPSPSRGKKSKSKDNTDPALATSYPTASSISAHGLSQTAWRKSTLAAKTQRHGLEPLLSGPLACLAFPSVSPAHVAAALRILSPGKDFPAPKRKVSPEYYAPEVQGGLQKLMLLGARVEGRAMDGVGVRWVGGVEGGIEGLRAQLVGLLGSAGMGLASVLEGAGRSLYMTVEGRRLDMEGGEKAAEGSEAVAEKAGEAKAES